MQAQQLHACFDPMPMSCQYSGYVGVGLKLSSDGEVQKSWIARTTYGDACPVTECMEEVVAGWFFEPLPEPMTLVIPVQVLRTRKPIPQWLEVKLTDDETIDDRKCGMPMRVLKPVAE